jgi:hypothetical protein
MPMIFLNFRPQVQFGPIECYCAISGNSNGTRGLFRTFSSKAELTETLAKAGIDESRYNVQLTAVASGYGSFLQIDLEEARELKLIDELHSKFPAEQEP